MSVTTEQKNGFFFVRITSDLISVCDGVVIKGTLQQALTNGTSNIVLSVTVGSLSNQHSISRLIRQCRQAVRCGNGNLYFVELNNDEKSSYRSICDSLQITIFDSEDKIGSYISAPVTV
jgi:hypothetical protein